MSDLHITISGTKRLLTKDKYCDKNIVVTAEGGGSDSYDEGYSDAQAEAEARNAKILEGCNAVLPTKGVSTAETLEQVPVRIGEIVHEENLMRLAFAPKFSSLGVFDKEEVILNLDCAESLDRMLYADWGYTQTNNTKVKHLVLNCARSIFNARQITCTYDEVLEHLTLNADFSKCTNCIQMFNSAVALRVIDGTPLNLSSSTNNTNMLHGSGMVEEIRFVPNTIKVSIGLQGSTKLSNATIQSIVDGLAEVATAQTLTLHADVGAKLTDEQKANITAKNWTLVY